GARFTAEATARRAELDQQLNIQGFTSNH
ncbi:MAG: hypothetical protein RI900_1595, partial [Actinomycetota bacterium]